MSTLRKIKRALRGEVKLRVATLEALRRTRASIQRRFENTDPDPLNLCSTAVRQAKFFDVHTDHDPELLALADQLTSQQFDWNRDPRSGYLWPLDYHRDIKLMRSDGSDIRVVWELNRLGHFITLARAYALTKDERFTTAFLEQLRSWHEHNPYGRG